MTVFEIVETDLSQLAAGEPILGLWTPKATSTELSFGRTPDSPSIPEATLWKINLPPNLEAAQSDLQFAETQLATAQMTMDKVREQLQITVQRQAYFDPVSYSGSITTPTNPEEELSFALSNIRMVEHDQKPNTTQNLQKSSSRFQQQLDHLMRSMLHYAWVETSLGNTPIAHTRVSWSGDVKAIWKPNVGWIQMNLHQRSVQLAIKSRSILIRTVGFVIEGLLQFSKLSNPATAMLALPSIWRYINRIVELRVEEKNHG